MSNSGWAEWRRFSAAMLALVGAFNVAEGLVLIYDGNVVRVDPSRVLLLDLAGWAQVTLTLGALLFSLGIWLSMVTVRVRIMALSVVLAHALTQLGVLAAFPAWALLMISCDVVIIFALTATPAGAAASVSRTAPVTVGGGDIRDVGAKAPVSIRTGLHPGSAAAVGGGRVGYGPGERFSYRPRHEMAGAEATVLLSQLTDAVVAGMAPQQGATTAQPGPTAHDPATPGGAPPQRALPPGPPAAAKAGADPVKATGTAPATTGPGKATGTAARGVAAPIIGAISGRWPDASLQ